MADMRVVGASIARREGLDKVTGRAVYLDDLTRHARNVVDSPPPLTADMLPQIADSLHRRRWTAWLTLALVASIVLMASYIVCRYLLPRKIAR